jgi:hypothetical protein
MWADVALPQNLRRADCSTSYDETLPGLHKSASDSLKELNSKANPGYNKFIFVRVQITYQHSSNLPRISLVGNKLRHSRLRSQFESRIVRHVAEDGIATGPGDKIGIVSTTLHPKRETGHTPRLGKGLKGIFDNGVTDGIIILVVVDVEQDFGLVKQYVELFLINWVFHPLFVVRDS